MRSLLTLVEVILLAVAVGLGVLWTRQPTASYEPQIVLCTLGLFAVEFLRRKSRRSTQAAPAGEQSPRVDSPQMRDSTPLAMQSARISLPAARHSPVLTLADEKRASLELTIVYRVNDPYKFTYEAVANPLLILQPLILSEVRKLLEPLTFAQAREKRSLAQSELKHIVSPEFTKYGLELESIILGAMELIG